MAKIMQFIYLSAIILCFYGHLTSGMPTYSEKSTAARKQLIKTLLEDYTEFMVTTIQHNKPIIEAVLNDPAIKANSHLQLETVFITGAMQAMEDSEDRTKYVLMYPIINHLSFPQLLQFIKKYDTKPEGDISPEEQLVRSVLEKNGLSVNDMLRDMLKRFKENTVPRVIKATGDFVECLHTSEDRLKQMDLIEFYEKFKAENNSTTEDKYILLTKLINTEKDMFINSSEGAAMLKNINANEKFLVYE